MIRSYFGLDANPFSNDNIQLLPTQQQVFETLKVHSQQGGLCLVVGEPGTGKSILKEAVCSHGTKKMITPVVNRTLHTYFSIVRILCEAFQIDTDGKSHSCEKRLLEVAQRINNRGKMRVPSIYDAHLLDTDSLRRLRLLFEGFPKHHNHILIAQPGPLYSLSLTSRCSLFSLAFLFGLLLLSTLGCCAGFLVYLADSSFNPLCLFDFLQCLRVCS